MYYMGEIAGIIKNGMQRGWPIQEIYQSLINTGYNPQEVQVEISKFNPQNNSPAVSNNPSPQKLSQYQVSSINEKKSASKLLLGAIIVLIILVLVSGTYILLN